MKNNDLSCNIHGCCFHYDGFCGNKYATRHGNTHWCKLKSGESTTHYSVSVSDGIKPIIEPPPLDTPCDAMGCDWNRFGYCSNAVRFSGLISPSPGKCSFYDKFKEKQSWDAYFLSIAAQVATRSTCLRRRVGAVLVADRRIVSTGYNGAPAGVPHCSEVGCKREGLPSGKRHELCRGAHADSNAVSYAGYSPGSTLYISGGTPCAYCAKVLINNGVRRVVCDSQYPDELGVELLRQAGVKLEIMKGG